MMMLHQCAKKRRTINFEWIFYFLDLIFKVIQYYLVKNVKSITVSC